MAQQPTGLGRHGGPLDGRSHAADEATDDGRIEGPLVLFEGVESVVIDNVAHRHRQWTLVAITRRNASHP